MRLLTLLVTTIFDNHYFTIQTYTSPVQTSLIDMSCFNQQVNEDNTGTA